VLKATRRAPEREADDETERRLCSYRPEKVDPSTWVAIRPFVLDCVRRLPSKGWPVAIRTLRVLTQLSAWAVGQGIALDAELVFDPDTIERFVVEGLAKNSSRANYRADLRRVARRRHRSDTDQPKHTRRAIWVGATVRKCLRLP
jgi:hypothetical protein